MGHHSTYRRQTATRASLAALGAALLCLAFTASALGAGPFHPRAKALDITGLNHACGTAVDNKGDVYASSAGESKVKVFNAVHTELTSISNANEPCGLAVTTTGNLYVSEQATGNVVRYKPNAYPLSGTPTYSAAEPIDSSGTAKGIAVDRFDDRLYVAEGDRIAVYGPAGTFAAANEVQQVEINGASSGTFRLSMPADGGAGRNEVQVIDLHGASQGTFTLSFKGQKTGSIPYDATPTAVTSALEGLATIGAGGVGVVGSPAGGGPWWVTFKGALAEADVPLLIGDEGGLEGFGGSRLITVEARSDITGPLPFNPSQAELEAALKGLSAIGAGDIEVQKSGPSFLVTFVGALAHTDVAALAADTFALVGGGVAINEPTEGFSGYIGEGKLSSATGVAAYTYVGTALKETHQLFIADAATDRVMIFGGEDYRRLKLRREISGPQAGVDFDFGAQGAYLAVDPGNRNAESKCTSIAEQACTAGHWLVYDDGHKAIYEFDATGEFLDQFTNPAFTDAKPTALAVERSGGSNDGTIYVTAGAEAGAKVLAFGPLTAPSRTSTPELSRVLKGVALVATDSYGNVYARVGALIHVYGPNGVEIKVGAEGKGIADPGKASDLAVDSTGKVYVTDVGNGFKGETKVTYLTPSAYPPVNGTTYTVHEPPIAVDGVAAGWPSECSSPTRIAINPSNDHVFLASGCAIHELDSAAPGHESAVLNANFAPGFITSITTRSIAVDGASGNVFAANGGNRSLVAVIDAAGTEALAQIDGAGSPQGPFGVTPYIAVDQSSGHFIEFQPGAGAREYDASGAFVAEFGKFTSSTRTYDVAVDNACALHDPPLDETTTPTCKAFDPANGTVYVAYDDPSSEIPFDVTAFGPLSYGEVPIQSKEFKLTVAKAGTGSGTVTSSPAGIECGPDCSDVYAEGTKVTLAASAAEGSTFVGWSGSGCSGTGTCEVTMSEARSVTAEFTKAGSSKHTLTLSVTGNGSVSANSGTISGCTSSGGPSCEGEYEDGAKVLLTETPGAHSAFSGWGTPQCDESTATTCEITISGDEGVAASFIDTVTLTVATEGAGTGTITSSPGLISCSPFCADEIAKGAKVTLTATAAPGSTFYSWKHCDSGGVNGRQCTVAMDKAKTVTAVFATTHALEVSKASGSGPGKVQSSPGGILCLANCSSTSASFLATATVKLTPTPAKHVVFTEWLGDCSGSGACSLTMGEDHEVEAKFTEVPKELLSLLKTGGGTGTVKSEPSGINCGASCTAISAAYYQGDAVTLTATPAKGSFFGGWSGGGCSGTGTCVVTISEAEEVQAEFK